MKKITVISSSFRNGNSLALANAFKSGAEYAGNKVRIIELKDLSMKFCLGCLYCQKTGVCVHKDDINPLLDAISESDVLVFATPVYYYEISGQLKTFLDRLNPLYIRDNTFKEVYLLSSCADTADGADRILLEEIKGWMSCFPGVELKGSLCANNVNEPGEVTSTKFADEAYSMGRNV